MKIYRQIKEYKLDLRDMIHRVTGQSQLIEEYNALTQKLYCAHDMEQDKARRTAMRAEINAVTKANWMRSLSDDGLVYSSYNPYKLNQNKTLRGKIKRLQNIAAKYGIDNCR